MKLFSCQVFVIPGFFKCYVFAAEGGVCRSREGQIRCAEILWKLFAEGKNQDVITSAGWKTAFLFYIMNILINALNSFYLIFS